jgi:hypothetical protein
MDVFWIVGAESGRRGGEVGRRREVVVKGSGRVVVIVALVAVSLLGPLAVAVLADIGLAVTLLNAAGVAGIATSPPAGPSPLHASACTM